MQIATNPGQRRIVQLFILSRPVPVVQMTGAAHEGMRVLTHRAVFQGDPRRLTARVVLQNGINYLVHVSVLLVAQC